MDGPTVKIKKWKLIICRDLFLRDINNGTVLNNYFPCWRLSTAQDIICWFILFHCGHVYWRLASDVAGVQLPTGPCQTLSLHLSVYDHDDVSDDVLHVTVMTSTLRMSTTPSTTGLSAHPTAAISWGHIRLHYFGAVTSMACFDEIMTSRHSLYKRRTAQKSLMWHCL